MPKKDYTNQRFGQLLVLKEGPTHRRPNGKAERTWLCQCTCGKQINVLQHNLQRNQSCGCRRTEWGKTLGQQFTSKNIAQQRFGHLIALEPTVQRNIQGCIIWKCQCDCGNICYIPISSLMNQGTQSCGCLKSKGEAKIAALLTALHIPYTTQKTFSNCKFEDTGRLAKFDFFIQEKILLEYDGQQHFTSTTNWDFSYIQSHDKIKTDWCLKNNIPLIRIPYTDYDKLDKIYLINLLHPYFI